MNRNHPFPRLAGLGLASALWLTGGAAGAAGEPIAIGVIGPQSGPSAEGGQCVARGAQFAVSRINAAGGINGRQLKLVVMDGKNDPAESLAAAQRLIMQDRVPVIMGAMGSSATLGIMPVVQRYKVPLLVETSSAAVITKQGNPFVFRIAATSEQEAEGVEPVLVKKLGFTKVALLGVNNDWGRGAAANFGKIVERQGGKVVATEYFEGDAVDFYPQLTKIKNSGANAVVLTADASLDVLVVKQMGDLQIKVPVLTTGGSDFTDGIIELAGAKVCEGLRSIAFFNPGVPDKAGDPQAAKAFVQEWKAKGYPWRRILDGARGYDGINVIAQAMRAIPGDIKADAVQKALQQVMVKGITGSLKFDANGQATRNIFLVKVQDGKVVLEP